MGQALEVEHDLVDPEEETDGIGQGWSYSPRNMGWPVVMAKFNAHVVSYFREDGGLLEVSRFGRRVNADGYTREEQEALDDH